MYYLGRPIIRPPPSATTTNRMKAQPNHVRRPRNSFILFRSWMIYFNLVPKEFTATQQERSEYVARHWASLSKIVDVKRAFEKLAEEEKREHALNHPDYKYAPGKAAESSAMVSSSSRRARTAANVSSSPPQTSSPIASPPTTFSSPASSSTRASPPMPVVTQNLVEEEDWDEYGDIYPEANNLYSLFSGDFASLPSSVSSLMTNYLHRVSTYIFFAEPIRLSRSLHPRKAKSRERHSQSHSLFNVPITTSRNSWIWRRRISHANARSPLPRNR